MLFEYKENTHLQGCFSLAQVQEFSYVHTELHKWNVFQGVFIEAKMFLWLLSFFFK